MLPSFSSSSSPAPGGARKGLRDDGRERREIAHLASQVAPGFEGVSSIQAARGSGRARDSETATEVIEEMARGASISKRTEGGVICNDDLLVEPRLLSAQLPLRAGRRNSRSGAGDGRAPNRLYLRVSHVGDGHLPAFRGLNAEAMGSWRGGVMGLPGSIAGLLELPMAAGRGARRCAQFQTQFACVRVSFGQLARSPAHGICGPRDCRPCRAFMKRVSHGVGGQDY